MKYNFNLKLKNASRHDVIKIIFLIYMKNILSLTILSYLRKTDVKIFITTCSVTIISELTNYNSK